MCRAIPVFSADRNVLYRKAADGLHLMLSPAANALTDYAVLAGTVELGASAFAANKTVTRVVLPEGLTVIGDDAFAGATALTELVIPESVERSSGVVGNSLELVEYGSKVTSIRMEGSWVPMPRRIVVRGGVDGSFVYDGRPTNGRRQSAYFGEGMTSRVLRRGRAARPRPAVHAHPPGSRAGPERREEGGHARVRRRCRRLGGVERREGSHRGGRHRRVAPAHASRRRR